MFTTATYTVLTFIIGRFGNLKYDDKTHGQNSYKEHD